MANPNKSKGTKWESDVRDYLNVALNLAVKDVDGKLRLVDIYSPFNVRRAAQEGVKDVGDVHAVPFVLECKDVAQAAVPKWLRQAVTEAHHAGYPYGVVVHKVRRANARQGRVHFPVGTWTKVRVALGLSTADMRKRYGFTPTIRGLVTDRWYMTTTVEGFADVLRDVRASRHAQ
ncbi:hypothetical protein ACFQ7F_13055 [Streptomyces sp. NPDC056486]|uniref:hypothetical protein n=1 Tax=Streptomyces sp. NPDC056486 TaxID=3345835 RepID=UPI0036C22EC3